VSLLEQAAADLEQILTDPAGFSVPITVTDPEGRSATINGLQTDIALSIDPETGQAVVGGKVSVALSIRALADEGLGIPRGIADESKMPWRVAFATPTSPLTTYKVAESMPDRLGVVVCFLEVWRA
jgi:hypothetical protein